MTIPDTKHSATSSVHALSLLGNVRMGKGRRAARSSPDDERTHVSTTFRHEVRHTYTRGGLEASLWTWSSKSDHRVGLSGPLECIQYILSGIRAGDAAASACLDSALQKPVSPKSISVNL